MESHRVQVLPQALANQIAAGEVVERPSSVVKELVENALDAGAHRVVVEVEDGGRSLIRVTDDGAGMTSEDVSLAVRRHATSKIRSQEDLHAIATLGFRGEALPSIASVSHFSLVSRTRETPAGIRISIDGGGEPVQSDAGCAAGTSVEVRDLFYNIPARLKFMKAKATEMGHIGRLVTTFALGHPEVHFRLVHNGRPVVDHPPENNLKARLYSVLGAEACHRLYEVYLDGEVVVRGFASEPTYSRPGTQGVYTYVNGRAVRERVLYRSISSAYGGLLDRGRYPHAVLYLEVPPDELDVNVHPTKHEVRFVRSGAVFESVSRAVKMMLASTPWVSQERTRSSAAPPAPTGPALPARYDSPSRVMEWTFGASGGGSVSDAVEPQELPLELPLPSTDQHCSPTAPPATMSEPEPGDPHFFSKLSYIGQMRGTYLVCEVGNRCVLVDQHAAHERVAYERLRGLYREKGLTPQRLLFPEQMELDLRNGQAVEAHQEVLERMGFEIEPFGGKTYVVKSVPEILVGVEYMDTIRDVIHELADSGTSRALDDRVDTIFATMACHSVVRAGDIMSPEEVRALFQSMDEIEYAANCPHGRPVLATLSFNEVERWFHRT